MLDSIMDLLAHLDIVEPMGGLLKMGTPSHRFVIDRNAGWSGADVEKLLKRHGIKMWHRGFTKDTLKFSVKKVQASWTEYLLYKHGIPVKSKPFYTPNAGYFGQPEQPQAAHPVQQKAGGSGIIKQVVDWLWN